MYFISDVLFSSSDKFLEKCQYLKICFRSLTYNHHMSQDYASDVMLEPIIWIVDNFSGFLGPVSIFFFPLENVVPLILIARILISVLRCCGCCFDISCSCDCTFPWAAILLAKKSIRDNMSSDIWLLATD